MATGSQNDATTYFFNSPSHNLLNTPKSQVHRLKRFGSILHYLNCSVYSEWFDFSVGSELFKFSADSEWFHCSEDSEWFNCSVDIVGG